MKRIIEPELLDHLPTDDPSAIRSRSDLRRLNTIMRHTPLLHAIISEKLQRAPKRIADIGAGDGTLMLNVAKLSRWQNVEVVLVERQKIISPQTIDRFAKLGWRGEAVAADVFDWAGQTFAPLDCVVANLFLHHFSDEKISGLFRMLARKTNLFIACETRRSGLSFTVSRLLGLVGCNSVTRHDAVLSMKAGFAERELSALWPDTGWSLEEKRTLLVTHLFVANRSSAESKQNT